jgi:putative hydrolase of the HAD superfamily
MKFYKHYSFDLWLTLIKSNPSFKKERASYFYKNLNTKKKSRDEVLAVFRDIDRMCNAINERTGKNIDPDELYLIVISAVNDFDINFGDVDLGRLSKEMDTLFFNYMPTLYCSDTLTSLERLKGESRSSFNIASNTGFINGKTLRKVLVGLGIDAFFEFQLYSDELGVSKPNSDFFQIVIDNIKNLPSNRNIALNEIVHVGDNVIADIEGASALGLNSFQINSNSSSILSLLI